MATTSKSKSAATNVVNKKDKAPKPANGSSEPAHTSPSPVPTPAVEITLAEYVSGKPERSVFDKEQEKIKAEIDALQVKLNAVRDKMSPASKNGSGNDRRTQLRNELESIRSQQSSNKFSHGKVIDQLKQVQEGIQKKIKDLNANKAKTKFKTVAEVDARVSELERQVDSGVLKLADEKRALQEITVTRRARRTVEGFQAEQEAIDREKETEEELRKQLEDPEAKAISERYEVIQAELDEIKKQGDEQFANRSKLQDERNALQAQLDTLYNLKRDSAQNFREANDRHWNKLNEDRARRAEKARAQKAADEESKKKELVERLREEAEEPAYQIQIEDCRTLIDSFSKGAQADTPSTPLYERADITAVPKLEVRKLDSASGDGLVARKKKGEDEESYFVGKSKKGKKGGAKSNGSTEPTPSSQQLNIPLATLSALLSLSIPPPTSSAEIPRVVEDLKTKKAWFEANQERVTKERIAKAEAEIKRLTGGKGTVDAEVDPEIIEPPNGGGEVPAEPAPTPQTKDIPSTAVPGEEVVDKLEHVQEEVEAQS